MWNASKSDMLKSGTCRNPGHAEIQDMQNANLGHAEIQDMRNASKSDIRAGLHENTKEPIVAVLCLCLG
jgi:hypothetical protein